MSESDAILDALRGIARKHRGLIRPQHVVEEARHKDSPLHSKFTWDNKKAADEHRLWQARELIAQYWIVVEPSNEPIRMFVSLSSDRPLKAGYRFTEKVLSDPDQRAEWVAMALADLQRWSRTYGALSELRPVTTAINRISARYELPEAQTG